MQKFLSSQSPARPVNHLLTQWGQPWHMQPWGFHMDKTLFALSLGFVGLILATHAANAAQCAPRDQVVAGLATGFDEVRRAAGLTGNAEGQAQVLEVFTSTAGTWTITVTMPDGMTCLVASGQAWEDITDKLPAKGDPA